MALETATYIDALVVSNPDGADARSTADDHLRLIKAALKRSFPMVAGAVSASAAAITYTNDLSASAQAQINALRDGSATALNAVNARYANSASVAANIGTIPAARVPDLQAQNSFSATLEVAFGNAEFLMRDSSGSTDKHLVGLQVYTLAGVQYFRIRALNDARTLQWEVFSAARESADATPVVRFAARPTEGGLTLAAHGDAIDATTLGGFAAAAYARLQTPQSWAGGQAVTQVNETGTAFTPNCDAGNMFRYVLTGAATINAPINARSGQVLSFHLMQDATGSRTVAWSSSFKFAGGSAPTLSTTPNYVDVFAFQYDATSGYWRQAGLGMTG